METPPMEATNLEEPLATGSDALSDGVRVRVWPRFIEAHSDANAGRWVFEYSIRIDNTSSRPLTLLTRFWLIIDGDGERHEVLGEGVIGKQPRIEPGEGFEYTSFCPLPTHWGTMEGAFMFIDDDGGEQRATVGRFFLVS